MITAELCYSLISDTLKTNYSRAWIIGDRIFLFLNIYREAIIVKWFNDDID